MPLFDFMARLHMPVWVHPCRWSDFPDYKGEPKRHYEIWWCFGCAYALAAAMTDLVFSGPFDRHPNMKIVTHYPGGMIPYKDGKIGLGWDVLGSWT